MKHKINPTVDCVFKAILGAEENKNLLIHFLNAVLEPAKGAQIKDVFLKNPYNEREFTGDKLTIVDVKAVDEQGKNYQVEVQLVIHTALTARMMYTWSSIYHSQIQEGDHYKKLKPVISIWILNDNLFENVEDCHLPFSVFNPKHQLVLTDHLAIHVLQLPKWPSNGKVKTEKERWVYLFKEGQNLDLDNPPEPLNTKEMRQVMKVLHRFSDNETDYILYQSRMEAVLKENTYLSDLEDALKAKEQAVTEQKQAVIEKEQAVTEKEQAVTEKEQAVTEKEQAQEKLNDLLLLLKKKGIDPDKELRY